MEKMGDEPASRFINALIKSVQTLCHGYLEFENGIEIIGHINLNVDKGGSLDYILKEKVCKNAENSTLFISNSFHAEPKGEQEGGGKETGGQTVQDSESADSRGKVSSAISSITSNLTGIRDRRRSSFGAKDSSHGHHRSGKRKASTDESDVCPPKVSSHHDGSNLSSDSTYQHNSSSPIDSKLGLHALADGESSETLLPQTANVTDHTDIGVNLAGSVLEPVENQNTDLGEREEDSDGDLEVTFIKEEYVEGDRSACEFDNSSQQYVGGPHDRNSEGMVDPSVFPVSLHSSSASSTYVPSAHDPSAVGQHYSGGVPSQPQPGPSGTRGNVCQQQAAQPVPPGSRPGCGYVHPADAQKWRMYELVPGTGVFIHQENYQTVMSKERDGQPDGKAMARYLMSCFWKQSELVGASIAEPPRPHHRSLDRGIINAILEFCRVLAGCCKRDVQRALWWKISAANNAGRKRAAAAAMGDNPTLPPPIRVPRDFEAALSSLPLGHGMPYVHGGGGGGGGGARAASQAQSQSRAVTSNIMTSPSARDVAQFLLSPSHPGHKQQSK